MLSFFFFLFFSRLCSHSQHLIHSVFALKVGVETTESLSLWFASSFIFPIPNTQPTQTVSNSSLIFSVYSCAQQRVQQKMNVVYDGPSLEGDLDDGLKSWLPRELFEFASRDLLTMLRHVLMVFNILKTNQWNRCPTIYSILTDHTQQVNHISGRTLGWAACGCSFVIPHAANESTQHQSP
ncbi:hypothetical protein VNO77_00382 [Canavalia gladiata]|uniref:Secreted protein n=1 Tax=Canavalia gladiata TaxID=3824 RepID=A0AAN9MPH6_CANGL